MRAIAAVVDVSHQTGAIGPAKDRAAFLPVCPVALLRQDFPEGAVSHEAAVDDGLKYSPEGRPGVTCLACPAPAPAGDGPGDRAAGGGLLQGTRRDRLTPKESAHVVALAQHRPGAQRACDIAAAFGQMPRRLGPRCARLIRQEILCRLAQGDIAFTAPMFNDPLMGRFVSTPDQNQ